MTQKLRNRIQAGQLLAIQLAEYANRSDVLVLGLPRGGVPVAFEIARALNVPLDICLVRKLGVPEQPELAMGAIAMAGVRIVNEDVVKSWGISQDTIEAVTLEEEQELARRDRAYRGSQPSLDLSNRIVILVDDGIATGATLRAAIAVVRSQHPTAIVVAAPVASTIAYNAIKPNVDRMFCPIVSAELGAIGLWYKDFSQTTDNEVRTLLSARNHNWGLPQDISETMTLEKLAQCQA